LIEGNYIHDTHSRGEDGIVAKRGNFEGLIIRNNEIKGWRDDGIDLYGGINIVVEYNKVHDVASTLNGSGNGIKAGGASVTSKNCIIRYNTVYNINSNSSGVKAGITSNGGDELQIYGNLIYNVQGEAIAIPSGSSNVSIYHNTAISNTKQALFVAGSNTEVRNNIFWGARGDMNINTSTRGNSNLFINGASGGRYSSSGDITASAASVFVDHSKRNYRLKSGSPAINRGVNISGYNKGISGQSVSGRPDIGAFQYGSSPTPSSPPPVSNLKVNAGKDVTLTLPTNSTNLKATISGNNGTSVAYRWSQKSGPSATLSNTTTSQLTVRNLREGTYVFTATAQASGKSASDDVQVRVRAESTPPAPSPSPPATSDNGLRYQYYEGTWSKLPNFASQTVIKQGTVNNFTIGVRQRSERFGIVFKGSIQISTGGTYTFYTNSDDGSQLFIDGKQIVNNDGLHAPRERSGKVTLSPGRYSIEVRFFERYGGQVLDVSYVGPGISKRKVPDNILFLDGSPEPISPSPPAPPEKPTPPPTASNRVWIEGECAVSVGSDWKVVSASSASQGKYLQTNSGKFYGSAPSQSSAHATYRFSINSSGSYKVYLRHLAYNASDDSFWVRINDGPWTAVYLSQGKGSYSWTAVAYGDSFPLRSGSNEITVAYREGNARLDKMYVSSAGDTPSGSGGTAISCGANAREAQAGNGSDKNQIQLASEETIASSEVVTYPNPARNSFTAHITSKAAENSVVLLTNVLGKEVHRLETRLAKGSNHLEMNARNLPPGTYLLSWKTATQSQTTKLIIER
jgi:hypothetical protein